MSSFQAGVASRSQTFSALDPQGCSAGRTMCVDIVHEFFVNHFLEHTLPDSALTPEHRVYPGIHDAIHLHPFLLAERIHHGYIFATRVLLSLSFPTAALSTDHV